LNKTDNNIIGKPHYKQVHGKNMSGIEINKIAAAILLAGLIAMVCGVVTEGLYHEGDTKKRGYTVEGAATTETASAAPAEEKPVEIAPYLAKADLKAGEQMLGRCTSCHTFEKGKPNGVGPNQYGLVGRKIASSEGFNYSEAMKTKGGVWDFQALSDFLTSPQKAVPGTRMAFAGLKKPEDRASLIAYINKNFSDKPLAVPTK
jgi:cytochrome c